MLKFDTSSCEHMLRLRATLPRSIGLYLTTFLGDDCQPMAVSLKANIGVFTFGYARVPFTHSQIHFDYSLLKGPGCTAFLRVTLLIFTFPPRNIETACCRRSAAVFAKGSKSSVANSSRQFLSCCFVAI